MDIDHLFIDECKRVRQATNGDQTHRCRLILLNYKASVHFIIWHAQIAMQYSSFRSANTRHCYYEFICVGGF